MSIRSRLVVVLLAAVLSFGVILAYVIYHFARQAITRARLEQLESVATIQKSRVVALVEDARACVAMVASRTAMRRRLAEFNEDGSTAARDAMLEILEDAKASYPAMYELAVVRTNYALVASTDSSRRDMAMLRKLRPDDSGIAFMGFGEDNAGNRALLFVAVLVADSSRLGYLVALMDPGALEAIVADHTGLGETGEVTLARKTAGGGIQFLAPLRFDEGASLRVLSELDRTSAPIARVLFGREEVVLSDAVDYRGKNVMCVTRYIEPYDWGLVVKMDRAEVIAPVVRLRHIVTAVYAVLCVVVGLLARRVASSISSPITVLTNAAERISRGDYTYELPRNPDGELKTLATAFDRMATQLIEGSRSLEVRVADRTRQLEEQIRVREETARKLREANRFLDSVIENIPNMVFVKKAEDLRFVRFNKAGEDLIGYTRDQLFGKNDYDFFPPDEADFFTRKDRSVLEGSGVLDIPEEPIQTRYKGLRYLHTKKIPLRDEEGRARFLLGISEDITDGKRAQEEAVRHTQEVEALNREMEALLSDLKAANDRLERTAQALREANEELESFSYSVSHDLRAPLRAINGYAQVMVEDYGPALDDDARHHLQRIKDGATNMGRLIDDLLMYARVARQDVEPATIDMNQLVRAAMADLAHELEGRDVDLRVGPLPPARGDHALLRQVWVNLLSNALKFTRPIAHPRIEVNGRVQDHECVYCVKDNGVGFDMKYLDKMFVIFQRLHSAKEFEGTGVGLAIVLRIVKRHGGRAWAESKLGEGALLCFTLPGNGAQA